MAITYVNKGTFASGTSSLTVTIPSGYTDGDILLLFVESANQAITTPSGWLQVPNSPQYTGAAAIAGGVRLAVFYKIVSGSQSSVSVADSGDHTTAIILCFRGVDTSNPFNATSGSIDSTAKTAMSWPAVTTTTDNCMIVNAAGLDRDSASTSYMSSHSNANLLDLTERHDQTVSSGTGGGIGIITGTLSMAGNSGNTTCTGATSTTHAYLTIALNPLIIYKGGSINFNSSSIVTILGKVFIPQIEEKVIMTIDNFFNLKIQGELIEDSVIYIDKDGNLTTAEIIETDSDYGFDGSILKINTFTEGGI